MAGTSQSGMFRKIFIMMWKNFLLRKRHYIQTALEIILPTLLFLILVTIHNTGDQDGQQGTNIIPANIPNQTLYPIEFCTSLKDMFEKKEEDNDQDDDNSTQIQLLAREIYYTNVPGDEDISNVQESQLAQDIMESVTSTVNDVIVPCCTLFLNITMGITFVGADKGILRQYFILITTPIWKGR